MKIIQITNRYCGKLQPSISIGKQYYAKEIAPLSDGTPCLEIRLNKTTKPHRINAKRFSWIEVEPPTFLIHSSDHSIEKLTKEAKRKRVEMHKDALRENLTDKELLFATITPFIVYEIAFIYIQEALDICKEQKISQFLKTSRRIKELLHRWRTLEREGIDEDHQAYINIKSTEFKQTNNHNFTLFYYTMNNKIKKYAPNYKHIDISTIALLSMMIIRVADKHQLNVSKLLQNKVSFNINTTRPPIVNELYNCLDVLSGNIGAAKIFAETEIQNCINVISNQLKKIEYNVIDKMQ